MDEKQRLGSASYYQQSFCTSFSCKKRIISGRKIKEVPIMSLIRKCFFLQFASPKFSFLKRLFKRKVFMQHLHGHPVLLSGTEEGSLAGWWLLMTRASVTVGGHRRSASGCSGAGIIGIGGIPCWV